VTSFALFTHIAALRLMHKNGRRKLRHALNI